MKFLLGIGFVNRPDLLYRAVKSIKPFWPNTMIFDNSDTKDLRKEKTLAQTVRIYKPPIPLTFPQMMNILIAKAKEEGCEVIMFMHNDAEARPGTPERFLQKLADLQRQGRRWGLAFTRPVGGKRDYDYLIAYNMKAIEEVGPWDIHLPQYYADTDYYWRIHTAGYEHIRTGLPVLHHGSSTIKSDAYRRTKFQETIFLYETYYRRKWGGDWFNERYSVPFAYGRPDCLILPPPGWSFPT